MLMRVCFFWLRLVRTYNCCCWLNLWELGFGCFTGWTFFLMVEIVCVLLSSTATWDQGKSMLLLLLLFVMLLRVFFLLRFVRTYKCCCWLNLWELGFGCFTGWTFFLMVEIVCVWLSSTATWDQGKNMLLILFLFVMLLRVGFFLLRLVQTYDCCCWSNYWELEFGCLGWFGWTFIFIMVQIVCLVVINCYMRSR